MEDTVFDKIIRREIPSNIVYEDLKTLAFLDIHPNNHGHTLVIPKKAARNIFDIDPETLGMMMQTAQKIAQALREAVGAEGVNIAMNNEVAAGQDVFYAHIHVIPRFSKDDFKTWPKKEYASDEAKEIAEKIRSKLP